MGWPQYYGRPMLLHEMRWREQQQKKRQARYDAAVAAKMRRKKVVMAQRARDREMPQRLLAAIDEADALLEGLGWRR